jgi:hypothetical protein
MSRNKKEGGEKGSSSNGSSYGEPEPISLAGQKFVDGHSAVMLLTEDARKESGLPFVGDETLSEDVEREVMDIPYRRDASSRERDERLDPSQQKRILRGLITRLTDAGFQRTLGLTKMKFKALFPLSFDARAKEANPFFGDPFYSLHVADEQVILRAAGISVRKHVVEGIRHVVQPTETRIRFTQRGYGFMGNDPRLVAWRSWLDYSQGRTPSYDLLMDLVSFAWLSLQYDVTLDCVAIAGSLFTGKWNNKAVPLCLHKTTDGWYVDAYRHEEHEKEQPALFLMSR